MLIVKIEPEDNGSHVGQTGTFPKIPDGYVEIPKAFKVKTLSLLPFINIIIERGVVTCIEDNATARAAWKVTPTPKPTKEEQIAALKAQLSASDYKVIKCAECSLAGLPTPYGIVSLNAERQAIRDQINALEATIQ